MRDGRSRRQKTSNFPADRLLSKHFYFSIPKRLLGSEEPLTVEIQHFKGLEHLSVGYFCFPSASPGVVTAQVFHCGKPIGEVALECSQGHTPPSAPNDQ
jgi:hypothetical protein